MVKVRHQVFIFGKEHRILRPTSRPSQDCRVPGKPQGCFSETVLGQKDMTSTKPPTRSTVEEMGADRQITLLQTFFACQQISISWLEI